MKLEQYWNILDNTQKKQLNTINWNLLHTIEDLDTQNAKEILSFIIDGISTSPLFNPFDFDKDLHLLNKISLISEYQNPTIFYLFNKIVQSYESFRDNNNNQSHHLKSNKALAKYFYHDFNNPLSEDFIKQHFFIPDIIHPVYARANTILDSALIDPELFSNFVALYSDNKAILLDDMFNTSSFYLKSDNDIINNEISIMNNKLNLKDITSMTIPQEVDNAMDFLRRQQYQYYGKLAQFFIAYPDVYQEKSTGKMPPIFMFLEKTHNRLDYYAQFNENHINLLMKHSKNSKFNTFVEYFFTTNLFFGGEDSQIKYFTTLLNNNLPPDTLNNLIASTTSNKFLIDIKKTPHHELCENFLELAFKNKNNQLKDLHILFKKQRFDYLVDKIAIKENSKKTLKI